MLTEPELAILKSLWREQPRSARQIHDELTAQFDWTYSSTRKTLERMSDKGLLSVVSHGNKNFYRTPLEKVPTLAGVAKDFFKKVFDFEGPLPIAMFSDSKMMSEDEIKRLEQLVNNAEHEKGHD
ncbi:BlaI/MecI/CopY family transcriptional regulator [Pseudoalteromonas xiamenensis]|uniref:BlaI/MecI/CopY family transcriptional regulator n=1 Tax=Pseudoalteromonas xiamenensis TaxID=882626 RepID=UPI0027E4D6A4|nr:BlaI/MecI/CopY family transcriptional regulator [Pseudoalteromonas xiamenensis]WMN59668.1 BlaI/MecI/CopY family transcriptional regulator [Pseudoalteromonas xiamenensis]